MYPYEFKDKDYKTIYEQAVREFNEHGIHHKQTYDNFLTRCMVSSILGFMKAHNIEVRDGKLYISKEEY